MSLTATALKRGASCRADRGWRGGAAAGAPVAAVTPPSSRVLAINSGSSSLKAAVYQLGPAEARVLSVEASRIGLPGSRLRVVGADERIVVDGLEDLPDHEAALQALFQRLDEERPTRRPKAIAAIRAAERAYPGVRQVACFDTGFHHGLPAVARRYALPRDLAEAGVVRYGFHGLSYEYVLREIRRIDGPAADARVVIAHLGNGRAWRHSAGAGASIPRWVSRRPAVWSWGRGAVTRIPQ